MRVRRRLHHATEPVDLLWESAHRSFEERSPGHFPGDNIEKRHRRFLLDAIAMYLLETSTNRDADRSSGKGPVHLELPLVMPVTYATALEPECAVLDGQPVQGVELGYREKDSVGSRACWHSTTWRCWWERRVHEGAIYMVCTTCFTRSS